MIKAELTVDQLNVNPYLPPEQEQAEAGQAGQAGSDGAADAPAEGWSDAPIDVSGLAALNADLAFNAGGIQFKDVKIGQSRLTVVLQDSKLTADLAERQQIGRAWCREREGQYVYIPVGAVSLKKKNKK